MPHPSIPPGTDPQSALVESITHFLEPPSSRPCQPRRNDESDRDRGAASLGMVMDAGVIFVTRAGTGAVARAEASAGAKTTTAATVLLDQALPANTIAPVV